MANLITLIRLVLVFIIASLALYAPPAWQLLNPVLIILMIMLDGIDGFIARIRHEVSVFGAVFDIAADRIIEITLWITFAVLNIVSVWVALIFLLRGVLVDSLRNGRSSEGIAPFSIMQTSWGKFLVASRTMRFTYGALKLVTFSWLALLTPMQALWPQFWQNYFVFIHAVSNILVYSTVAFCLVRGIPVLLEAI